MRTSRCGPENGFTYLEVLLALAIALVVVTSTAMAFTSGARVSSAMQARIELLNLGQREVERIRGLPFDGLTSYSIESATASGAVTVDEPSPRRKQVTISLRHLRYPNQTLLLVTYVHRQGLNR